MSPKKGFSHAIITILYIYIYIYTIYIIYIYIPVDCFCLSCTYMVLCFCFPTTSHSDYFQTLEDSRKTKFKIRDFMHDFLL